MCIVLVFLFSGMMQQMGMRPGPGPGPYPGGPHMGGMHLAMMHGPGGHGKIYPPHQAMVFNPSNPNAPPIYPCGICHKEVIVWFIMCIHVITFEKKEMNIIY